MGLLERVPQRINERPPYYLGRNHLETLMASQNVGDWVQIRSSRRQQQLEVTEVETNVCLLSYSEMLLGPVPNNFKFLPKHKANAYK